jgi:hypothetical protein
MSVTSSNSESAPPADHWQSSRVNPRFESGDRLTADEFMRCSEAMPDHKKVAQPELSRALARPGGTVAG